MPADDGALVATMRTVAEGDRAAVDAALDADPSLAVAGLGAGATRAVAEEFFLEGCGMHVYAGDTLLHVAASAYDLDLARHLVDMGADLATRNRRGARPLHSATTGSPNAERWNPTAQAAIVAFLIEAGADPNSTAAGGVTPLHRAVRNRCTGAVRALLDGGANPSIANAHGSTALDLAHQTTGRGGTGSSAARQEQSVIIDLLSR